jgi:hypothetical protein
MRSISLACALILFSWALPGRVGAGVDSGGALTAPNYGIEGTLDVLPGNGTRIVWSLDIASNTWTIVGTAPDASGQGGALSNLFNSCDFALIGGGSTRFFRTAGAFCGTAPLANTPAAVGPGGALATAPGLGSPPTDSVFALRGGGTTDFWRYSISGNAWSAVTTPPPIPGPADDGAALVEIYDNQGLCGGTGYQVAMIRGGSNSDFWCYSISRNQWIPGPGLPAPPGPGAALAQLQGLGRIYLLAGGGTTGFWMLDWTGQWTALASTPGPVGAGGALVGINYGTQSQKYVLYALQGGGSSAVWRFDVATNTWSHLSDVPVLATSFFTVTPCRVFDSRLAGLGGPTPFAAGSRNRVAVTGNCGIPSEASAVSLNVTVTAPSEQGHLRLFRGGAGIPTVSTINYGLGQTRANNAVIQLGTSGALDVYVGQRAGSVHVVVDVNGYFK